MQPKHARWSRSPIQFILLLSASLLFAVEIAASGELTVRQGNDMVEFQERGKTVLVYSFASNQFKPYVKELRTRSGRNVLLDGPPDHLHHHGLMYAIRINGTNFWEELPDSGRQLHVRLLGCEAGGSSGRLAERIYWMAPKSDEPLLVEERIIELDTTAELALTWRSKFVGSSRVDLQACKLEYSIVSPK